MLVDQKVEIDREGKVHVFNTFDQSGAALAARMCEEAGGGRARLANGSEVRAMGFIPNEMWIYDPWLIEAKKAQKCGDAGQYTKYIKKFFEVHREYAPLIPKKYY